MRQLLSALLFAVVLYGAFESPSWTSRRQVKTTPAPYNVLTLDSSVYASSKAELSDLRLLRSGTEVPYVLRTLSGAKEERTFSPSVSNRVALPGVGVQATLDVGRNVPHNRVTIDTGETNFREQLRVETSEDGRHWGTVREDGTVFDITTADQHASDLSVSYPVSNRRFLRITVKGWANTNALRSPTVSFLRETMAVRDLVADLRPTVVSNGQGRTSTLDLDLGFERPCDQVSFEVAPGLFSRAVSVSVSRDGVTWSAAGYGTIERTSRGEQLDIAYPEQWSRYLRAVVSNQDNPGLVFTRLRAHAIRRELVFPSEERGSYWLYSGNSAAAPVRYDLEAILPARVSPVHAKLGPVEKNPDYRAPSMPVTERSPWLLSALLLILTPIVGWIAFRMLRQIKVSR